MTSASLRFDIITLFPNFFESPLGCSLISKALKNKLIEVNIHDMRKSGKGVHKQVDDRPFGGGPGMVLKPDVLLDSLRKAISLGKKELKSTKPHIILLDPTGNIFKQEKAVRLSKKGWIILICGHYEGVDERFKQFVSEEVSIGDYVLGGGETAAFVLIDAISRMVPGFLGKDESATSESFTRPSSRSKSSLLLDYPAYTRPENFLGTKVPQALLSGNHKEIAKWRTNKRIEKTRKKRPDLLN